MDTGPEEELSSIFGILVTEFSVVVAMCGESERNSEYAEPWMLNVSYFGVLLLIISLIFYILYLYSLTLIPIIHTEWRQWWQLIKTMKNIVKIGENSQISHLGIICGKLALFWKYLVLDCVAK